MKQQQGRKKKDSTLGGSKDFLQAYSMCLTKNLKMQRLKQVTKPVLIFLHFSAYPITWITFSVKMKT